MSSSPIVSFEGREIALRDKETVLEALEREGVPVMSSCRAGVCQSCLMQATDGQLPPKAQQPLKESLRAQGYFLACVCVPEGNLSVALPGAGLEHEATVLESEDIGAAVRRVRLTIPDGLDWFAGQYITVIRDALIAIPSPAAPATATSNCTCAASPAASSAIGCTMSSGPATRFDSEACSAIASTHPATRKHPWS
jgi:CDP-4-dehydro-6-deoxyglucose reductase